MSDPPGLETDRHRRIPLILAQRGAFRPHIFTAAGSSLQPSTFGQLVAVGRATTALPSLANIDPPRMFQLQARFSF